MSSTRESKRRGRAESCHAELFFGFVLSQGEDDRQEVVLIEKKVLLDASIPSEETEKRQILLHKDESTYTVGMNTTSLVFAVWLKKDEESNRLLN